MSSSAHSSHMEVLITGFGAFGAVEDNPSYKIVSSLPPELALHDGRTVRLLAYPEPVKVAYKDVLELIPALYRDYPKISFFVHLGVNGGSRQYHVERRARKGPYNAPGVDWKPFKEAEHPEWKGYLPELYTRLDVDALVKRAGSGVDAEVVASSNAGLYLCEFIFYNSLVQTQILQGKEKNRIDGVFLHVPPGLLEADIQTGRDVLLNLVAGMAATIWKDTTAVDAAN